MKKLAIISAPIIGVLFSGCATDQETKNHSGGRIGSVPENVSRPPFTQLKNSWISEPASYPHDGDGSPISENSYWQTQVTTLPMAIRELDNYIIVALSDEDARFYAGPHYKKQLGMHPYLVRGVFWNYTGDFSLFWRDGELFVSHSSLGHIRGETKLPLIINLKRTPKRVYTYMGSAL